MGYVVGPGGYEVDPSTLAATMASSVHRAIETGTGRVVALKRLRPGSRVREGDALLRLQRELDAVGALGHAAIVKVTAVIDWEGDPTLVMDFIEGEGLHERLERAGALPAEEAERIAHTLLDALAVAHAAGIVHRRIEPRNIRLGSAGQVYLLGLGSARLEASAVSPTGAVAGTPCYMAPELFAGPVYDPRADVYAVGATLYECLSGRPPGRTGALLFAGSTPAETGEVPPIGSIVSDLPEGLTRLVDRCLARAPEDRFASAALALWALDHPAAERALVARRALCPLCLHCSSPIPRESAACSSCGSPHPFRYTAGSFHVDITSVASVAQLADHMAIRFPERATAEELESLAQRCAGLAFGPQRWVSSVSEEDATRIVAELAGAGTRATVVRPPTGWRGLAADVLLPFRRPLAELGAKGSILSTSQVPRPIDLRATHASAFAVTFSFAALLLAGMSDLDVASAHYVLLALGATFIVGSVAFLASLALGFNAPTLAVDASPQPSDRAPDALGQRQSGAVSWVTAASIAVVITVVAGLLISRNVATRPAERVPRAGVVITPPSGYVDVSPSSAAPAPPAFDETTADAVDLVAALGSGGLVAYLLLVLARRRSRVRREAATLAGQVDMAAFTAHAERPAPSRQGAGQLHPFAGARTGDRFTREAIRRAAHLMPLLARDQAGRLAASIESLLRLERESAAALPAADGSPVLPPAVESRAILETDPQQRLRFELLTLEGQLEAEAAAEWLAQLEREDRHEPKKARQLPPSLRARAGRA